MLEVKGHDYSRTRGWGGVLDRESCWGAAEWGNPWDYDCKHGLSLSHIEDSIGEGWFSKPGTLGRQELKSVDRCGAPKQGEASPSY